MTGIDLTQAHYAQEAWNLRAAAHLALNAAPLRAKLADYVNEDGEIDWHGMRYASNVWPRAERELVWLACSFADEVPMESRANIAGLIGPGFPEETVEVIVEAVRIACTGRVG
jgi:hypothetical protein